MSMKELEAERVTRSVIDYYVSNAPPNTTLDTIQSEAAGILMAIESWMDDNWRWYEEGKKK